MQAWARAYTTIPLKSLVAGEFEAPQDCPILRDYEDAMNRVRTALKQIRQGGLTDEQAREQADVLEDAMSLAVQAMRDITFIAGLSVGHKRTIITQNMAKEEAAHSDQRPRG